MGVDVRQVLERFEDYRRLRDGVRDAIEALLEEQAKRLQPLGESQITNYVKSVIGLFSNPPEYTLGEEEIRIAWSGVERVPYIVQEVVRHIKFKWQLGHYPSVGGMMPRRLKIVPAIEVLYIHTPGDESRRAVLGAFYEAAIDGKTVTGFVQLYSPLAFYQSYDEFDKAVKSVK